MGWLDATWFAVCVYLLLFLLTVVLGVQEVSTRRRDTNSSLWPTFWFVTAALVLAMAAGRGADTGQFLADLGRERAQSQGWYEGRRSLQAEVIGGIAVFWFVTVAVAIWRVPERRRRYLPTALTIFTVVCEAGIRIISLHHVDTLLHNRRVGDVTIGSIIELTLLVATLLATAVNLRSVSAVPRSSRGNVGSVTGGTGCA